MSKISETLLQPVLEAMLHQFPFRILGFHSDNGSEFINHTVANLLEKLLIEFTKSRANGRETGAISTSRRAVCAAVRPSQLVS